MSRPSPADALRPTSGDPAVDLLREHAQALSGSPLARDQRLSLALRNAAARLQPSPSASNDDVLGFLGSPAPGEEERTAVRRRVFEFGTVPTVKCAAAVKELERRCREEGGSDVQVARALVGEAKAHEALWDDPRLACDDRTRLVMLLSVPILLARAEVLDPFYSLRPGASGTAPARGRVPASNAPWMERLSAAWPLSPQKLLGA